VVGLKQFFAFEFVRTISITVSFWIVNEDRRQKMHWKKKFLTINLLFCVLFSVSFSLLNTCGLLSPLYTINTPKIPIPTTPTNLPLVKTKTQVFLENFTAFRTFGNLTWSLTETENFTANWGPIQDAYIDEYNNHLNTGTYVAMYCSNSGTWLRKNVLVQFSQIYNNSYALINGTCQISLYAPLAASYGSKNISIYEIDSEWNESTVTWLTSPSIGEFLTTNFSVDYNLTYGSFIVENFSQFGYMFEDETLDTGITWRTKEYGNRPPLMEAALYPLFQNDFLHYQFTDNDLNLTSQQYNIVLNPSLGYLAEIRFKTTSENQIDFKFLNSTNNTIKEYELVPAGVTNSSYQTKQFYFSNLSSIDRFCFSGTSTPSQWLEIDYINITQYNDTSIDTEYTTLNLPDSPTFYHLRDYNFTANFTEPIWRTELNTSSAQFRIYNDTWDSGFSSPAYTLITRGASYYNDSFSNLQPSNYTLNWMISDMEGNTLNLTESYEIHYFSTERNQSHLLVYVEYDKSNFVQLNTTVRMEDSIHYHSNAFNIDADGEQIDTNYWIMNFTVNDTNDLLPGIYSVNVSSTLSWAIEEIEVRKRNISISVLDYDYYLENGTTKTFTFNCSLEDLNPYSNFVASDSLFLLNEDFSEYKTFRNLTWGLTEVEGFSKTTTVINDTYIDYYNPDTNYGSSTLLDVDYDNQLPPPYYLKRAVVLFDNFSSDFYNESFELYENEISLYCSVKTGGDRKMNFYNLSSSWNETDLTWNNQPGYDHFFNGPLINGIGWYDFHAGKYLAPYGYIFLYPSGTTTGHLAQFNSKEHGSNNPKITAYYSPIFQNESLVYFFTDNDMNLISPSYNLSMNTNETYGITIRYKTNNTNEILMNTLDSSNTTIERFKLISDENNIFDFQTKTFILDSSTSVDRLSFSGTSIINCTLEIDYIKIHRSPQICITGNNFSAKPVGNQFIFENVTYDPQYGEPDTLIFYKSDRYYYNSTLYQPSIQKGNLATCSDQNPAVPHSGDEISLIYQVHNEIFSNYLFYNGSFDKILIQDPESNIIDYYDIRPGFSDPILKLGINGNLSILITNSKPGIYFIQMITKRTFDYETKEFWFSVIVYPREKANVSIELIDQLPDAPDGYINESISAIIKLYNASNPTIPFANQEIRIELIKDNITLQMVSGVFTNSSGYYNYSFNLQGNGNYSLKITTLPLLEWNPANATILITTKIKENITTEIHLSSPSGTTIPGEIVDGYFVSYNTALQDAMRSIGGRNWTAPMWVSAYTSSPFNIMAKQQEVDDWGNLHFVLMEQNGAEYDITYKFWNGTTNTWSGIECLTDGFPSVCYQQLAVDNTGKVHVVFGTYYDQLGSGNDFDWYYTYRDPVFGNWSDIELVSTESNDQSEEAQVCVDDDGNVFVVWKDWTDIGYGDDPDLWCKIRNGSTGFWEPVFDVLPESNYGADPTSWDFASDGTDVWFVWQDYADDWGQGDMNLLEIYARRWEGVTETLTPVEMVGNLSNHTKSPSCTIDKAGNVHVLFFEYMNNTQEPYFVDYDARYIFWNQSTKAWSEIENVSNTLNWSYQGNIAVDGQGIVHVIWEEFDDTSSSEIICFYYAYRFPNGTWNYTIMVDDDPDDLKDNAAKPQISCSDDHIFFSWLDKRDYGLGDGFNNFDIFLKSTNPMFCSIEITNFILNIIPSSGIPESVPLNSVGVLNYFNFTPLQAGEYILQLIHPESYDLYYCEKNFKVEIAALPSTYLGYAEMYLHPGETIWAPPLLPYLTITINISSSSWINITLLNSHVNQSLNDPEYSLIFLDRFYNIQMTNNLVLEYLTLRFSYENITLGDYNLTWFKLRMVYYNTTTWEWEYLNDWKIHPPNRYIMGNTSHLSYFAPAGIYNSTQGGSDSGGRADDGIPDSSGIPSISIRFPNPLIGITFPYIQFDILDHHGTGVSSSDLNVSATLGGVPVTITYNPLTQQYDLFLFSPFMIIGNLVITVEYNNQVTNFTQPVFQFSWWIILLAVAGSIAVFCFVAVRRQRKSSIREQKRILLKIRRKYADSEKEKTDEEITDDFFSRKKVLLDEIIEHLKSTELSQGKTKLKELIERCKTQEDVKGYETATQLLRNVQNQINRRKAQSELKGKPVFSGLTKTGKTSIHIRFKELEAEATNEEVLEKVNRINRTTRVAPIDLSVELPEGTAFVDIWDSGGQDNYLKQLRERPKIWWRDVKVFVYFINSQKPEELEKSYHEFLQFREIIPKNAKILLVLSKYDDIDAERGEEKSINKVAFKDVKHFNIPETDVYRVSIFNYNSIDLLFRTITKYLAPKPKIFPIKKISAILFHANRGEEEISNIKSEELRNLEIPSLIWNQHPKIKKFSDVKRLDREIFEKNYLILSIKIGFHLEGEEKSQFEHRGHEKNYLHQICTCFYFNSEQFQLTDPKLEVNKLSNHLQTIGTNILNVIEAEEGNEYPDERKIIDSVQELLEKAYGELVLGKAEKIRYKLTKKEKKLLARGEAPEILKLKQRAETAEKKNDYTNAIDIYKEMIKMSQEQGLKLDIKQVEKRITKVKDKLDELKVNSFDLHSQAL